MSIKNRAFIVGARVVDGDLDALRIGQGVKREWTPAQGGPPVFTFTPL